MIRKPFCCCWDLEGPISITDFAAELANKLNEKSKFKLLKFKMNQFFTMISNYDDYLIDAPGVKESLNIPEYQPGDTLRLMAPLYISFFNESEMVDFAKKKIGLLPGCKELMKIITDDWNIFIISTSYSQFAYTIAEELNIPKDHVYCTKLNISQLKEGLIDINNNIDILLQDIFKKYLSNSSNLKFVIEDLNRFFWKNQQSDYIAVMNEIKVIGGKRKESAIEDISKQSKIPISEIIALGDSITDINMLERVKNEGGIAISFNGNKFTIPRANVAVTTSNSLGLLPIFRQKQNIKDFLTKWEAYFKDFKSDKKKINDTLISKETKKIFLKYNFLPEIYDLTNKSEDQLNKIILSQEKMRKSVRGWAGNLG
ncbi:MAG: HAD hydrolase family protein [Promethearchaeota archaeon]